MFYNIYSQHVDSGLQQKGFKVPRLNIVIKFASRISKYISILIFQTMSEITYILAKRSCFYFFIFFCGQLSGKKNCKNALDVSQEYTFSNDIVVFGVSILLFNRSSLVRSEMKKTVWLCPTMLLK